MLPPDYIPEHFEGPDSQVPTIRYSPMIEAGQAGQNSKSGGLLARKAWRTSWTADVRRESTSIMQERATSIGRMQSCRLDRVRMFHIIWPAFAGCGGKIPPRPTVILLPVFVYPRSWPSTSRNASSPRNRCAVFVTCGEAPRQMLAASQYHSASSANSEPHMFWDRPVSP